MSREISIDLSVENRDIKPDNILMYVTLAPFTYACKFIPAVIGMDMSSSAILGYRPDSTRNMMQAIMRGYATSQILLKPAIRRRKEIVL
jgi:hypothetical protein